MDNGAYWLSKYESETIKEDVEGLYETLKPLYLAIHTYARAKLRNVYGGVFRDDGLIPAHLLGNKIYAIGKFDHCFTQMDTCRKHIRLINDKHITSIGAISQ